MPWVARLREKLATHGVREFVRSVRISAGLPPTGRPRDPSLADEYEIACLRIYSNRDGVEWYRGDKPFDPSTARTGFTEAQVREVKEGALKLAGYLGVPLTGLAFLDLEQLILFDTLQEHFAERYAVPSTKGEHKLALKLALNQLKGHPPQGRSVAEIRQREMARLLGPPASAMDLELVLFVEANRLSWDKRRVKWNQSHPDRRFNPGDSMRVSHRAAKTRLRVDTDY